VQKDQLRLMQEAIKAKLALNEIKGDLRLAGSRRTCEFESAKRDWLDRASRHGIIKDLELIK
jgi:hypothetical protein